MWCGWETPGTDLAPHSIGNMNTHSSLASSEPPDRCPFIPHKHFDATVSWYSTKLRLSPSKEFLTFESRNFRSWQVTMLASHSFATVSAYLQRGSQIESQQTTQSFCSLSPGCNCFRPDSSCLAAGSLSEYQDQYPTEINTNKQQQENSPRISSFS